MSGPDVCLPSVLRFIVELMNVFWYDEILC